MSTHDFGTMQGTPLDNIRSQEQSLASISRIEDINRNRPEKIIARIISGGLNQSKDENKSIYKVQLKSGEIKEAILDGAISFWKGIKIPKEGDVVEIETTRECSKMLIVKKIDESSLYDIDINKRYQSEDGKNEFSWWNTIDNDEDKINKRFQSFADTFLIAIGLKSASVATKP